MKSRAKTPSTSRFKDLTSDEKLAHVVAMSDKAAASAIETARLMDDIERNVKLPHGAPAVERTMPKVRNKDKLWIPFYAHKSAKQLINQMATDWNVSGSTVMRLCLAHVAAEYGFSFSKEEILLMADRKAMRRSERVRRPFITRQEALAKRDGYERGIRSGLVRSLRDDSERGEPVPRDLPPERGSGGEG